ncbi:hypothetical protein F5Y08DRAFT_321077 [Xylaria arbuscula]|nr:hypothetical protein F5Y08DRAFT_321077 [Xylaria arbuscula]
MHSTKTFLTLAAVAGTAISQKSDSEFCNSYLSSFFNVLGAEAPTTPADILSFIASQTAITTIPQTQPAGATLDPAKHQSQLCSLATALPSSLLPEFQSLASGLLSFGKAHSSDFIAYVTDCYAEDQVAASSSYLEYVFSATGNICTETATATPGGVSNGTYPTATPTATTALNGTTSLIPTAAAVRPTGALLGAAAAGGVLGAAALL